MNNDYSPNIIMLKHMVNDIYNDLCGKKDVRKQVDTLLEVVKDLKDKVDTIK